MTGRPSSYTPETGDRICAEIADGASLRRIEKMPGMPDRTTIFRWRRNFPEFKAQFDAAALERVAVFAEDIIEISDDGSNDWMADNDPDNPGYRFNGENYQRSRLRVDTRKWILSKMDKRYADKVDLTHAAPGGGPVRLIISD